MVVAFAPTNKLPEDKGFWGGSVVPMTRAEVVAVPRTFKLEVTRKVESMVDEAVTKMPRVEVGVIAPLAPKIFCQAPLVPAAAPVIVREPAPVATDSPPAPVRVAATGAAPVEPISNWPLVKTVAVRGEVPLPMMMPLKLVSVSIYQTIM